MQSIRDYYTRAAEGSGDYAEARRVRYDPLPEQIARITKALSHLATQGVDIGPDGLAQLDHVAAVKAAVPKPVGVGT